MKEKRAVSASRLEKGRGVLYNEVGSMNEFGESPSGGIELSWK